MNIVTRLRRLLCWWHDWRLVDVDSYMYKAIYVFQCAKCGRMKNRETPL